MHITIQLSLRTVRHIDGTFNGNSGAKPTTDSRILEGLREGWHRRNVTYPRSGQKQEHRRPIPRSHPCTVDVKRTPASASSTASVREPKARQSSSRNTGFVVDFGSSSPFEPSGTIIGGPDRSVTLSRKPLDVLSTRQERVCQAPLMACAIPSKANSLSSVLLIGDCGGELSRLTRVTVSGRELAR